MNSSQQNLRNIKITQIKRLDYTDKNQRTSPGFTVLEFLVAAFVLIIIVGSSLLIFRVSSSSVSHGENKTGIYEAGRDALDFMLSRLRTALVNDWKNNRINFIGEKEKAKFICPFSTRKDSSDICKIIFYLKNKELRVWTERMGKEGKDYSLPDSFPGSQILISNVKKITFEYYNGGSWKDSWDSREGAGEDGRLPRAVRIIIKISAPSGSEGKEPLEKTFTGITYLESS